MTVSEQSAVLLVAGEIKLIKAEDIIRWAETVIATTDGWPDWVVELSIFQSPYFGDFVARIREQTSVTLSVHRQVQIIVLGYNAGLLTLKAALPPLFEITFFEPTGPLDELDEKLVQTLVDWDCQEDSDEIGPELEAKFKALFREYLIDASEVVAVLPWKFEKAG